MTSSLFYCLTFFGMLYSISCLPGSLRFHLLVCSFYFFVIRLRFISCVLLFSALSCCSLLFLSLLSINSLSDGCSVCSSLIALITVSLFSRRVSIPPPFVAPSLNHLSSFSTPYFPFYYSWVSSFICLRSINWGRFSTLPPLHSFPSSSNGLSVCSSQAFFMVIFPFINSLSPV